MADAPADWDDTLAGLARQPGFAGIDEPGSSVLVWDRDARLLWRSEGAASLAAQVGADGSEPAASSFRDRIRILAGGEAPREGIRLERLRPRAGGLAPPTTFACRAVRFGEADALLTASLDPPSRRSASAGANGGHPRPATVPLPPAAEPAAEPPARRRRGRRFTWRMDEDGRFDAVSDALATCVGAGGARILGHRWADVVDRLVADETGAVGRALASGAPFVGVSTLWRDPEAGRVVPVSLAGAPSGGVRRSSGGFRGFGLADPEAARPEEPGRFLAPPDAPQLPAAEFPSRSEPVHATGSDPEQSRQGSPVALDEAIGAATAALTGTAGETVFGVLKAWFAPALGVADGSAPNAGGRPPTQVAEPTPAASGSPEPACAPVLSTAERGALHEIARTLGDAGAGDMPAPDGRPSAEIVPLRQRRPGTLEPTELLDQLPFGIVVLREGIPLFLNRFLRDAAGLDNAATLAARGLSALLDPPVEPEPGGSALPTGIRRPDGTVAPARACTVCAPWGELPARLLILWPREEPVADAVGPEIPAPAAGLARRDATIDLLADGVVTLDMSGRVLSMSASAERLFGVSSDTAIGDTLAALLSPDDHRAVQACLEAVRLAAPGTWAEREVHPRTGPDERALLSMRAAHLAGESGPLFALAFRDVSRSRRLEDELREARATAERASANQAEFLARVSHEIRTPLTAITGFAELMLEERFGEIGSDRYRGYIRDIHDSGVHVISLVNDLLDLAKVTSGSSELSPARFDLNALARQCVALAAPIATRERTILRTGLAPSLPPAFADERAVRQVIINVLSNAIRFTGAGGQVIVSTAESAPGEVALRVRDTGPGMNRDEIEAALTPFRQVSSTRRGDGTGLGLPLSKALVEANGGVFSITSSAATGTLIEVRLPAAATRIAAIAAE